jgi:hypothetical protein
MDDGEIETVKEGKVRLIIVQSLHDFIARRQERSAPEVTLGLHCWSYLPYRTLSA